MTVRQLRPFRDPTEDAAFYTERYPEGYDHSLWPDHRMRVEATVDMAVRWAIKKSVWTMADLTCGNGAIIAGITDHLAYDVDDIVLGDINESKNVGLTHIGPIEKTLDALPAAGVDMFILSETLEHVVNPPLLLSRIRRRARMLVLSTPTENWDDQNPEHYWAWDVDDVRGLLTRAGWNPLEQRVLRTGVPGAYLYQMWVCE